MECNDLLGEEFSKSMEEVVYQQHNHTGGGGKSSKSQNPMQSSESKSS